MKSSSTPEMKSTFTGQKFSRKPRRRVLWGDAFARRLIAVSGVGSIVAVMLVGLFLAWVALPLVLPTRLTESHPMPGSGSAVSTAEGPLASAIDNYGIMGWEVTPSGEILVRSLRDGQLVDRFNLAPDMKPRSWAFGVGTGPMAIGYADGQVQTGRLSWQTRFLSPEETSEEISGMAVGERRVWEKGVLVRTPEGQLRQQKLVCELAAPIAVSQYPLDLLDMADTPQGLVIVALDSTGVFQHRKLKTKTNMLTGEVRIRARGGHLVLNEAGVASTTDFKLLKLDDTGDLAMLIKTDGSLVRLERSGRTFRVSGFQDIIPDPTDHLTAITYLNGSTSLLVGDSAGRLTVWFAARTGQGDTIVLQAAHALKQGAAAVTAVSASERSRMLAVGYADGRVRVFNATTEKILGENTMAGETIVQLTLSPREDLLLVQGDSQESLWTIDAPYGEFSVSSLVRPVWYEGYPGPGYVWQSSAASDSFEPKLSLVPLIFGTLKATFYSLLFGLPLALLAAIFTSEFLSKKARSRVKPVIEIMASLPSVVLGFLAALVVAPWVESVVVEVLAVIIFCPFFVILGAHLWQLLPRDYATRWEKWRPLLVLLALVVGTATIWNIAPSLEKLAFAGDFKAWLSGGAGSGISGWFVLLIVPGAVAGAWLNYRYGDDFMRAHGGNLSSRALALMDLARFLVVSLAILGLTLFVSWLVNGAGWDPRGSVFDTYVQRNALVVGIAMGFAVIPLIYSISEDALVAVPDHLRAASLGAGATPWQTAIRVVVPPAMSGLFSAAMIGLGRAVGETMIVLMAAGNTPIMEMNIFNGFRTLAANLAVELPEAVKDSTHYRTLFLAALTLFVMTFVLNTVAEAVRLRFRGKASRL